MDVERSEASPRFKDEPETKMKRNLFQAVSFEMLKTVEQERMCEEAFKKSVRNKISRQVKIVDSKLTEAEVDHYVNNPEEAQLMLNRKVFGQASNQLKNAVTDIQCKLRDVQKLEQSVNECLQLFKELSAMVYAQGQVIDNIEMTVNQAKGYVEKGEVQLMGGKKRHQRTRKCMCWFILIAIIILVVIICIVVPVVIKAVK